MRNVARFHADDKGFAHGAHRGGHREVLRRASRCARKGGESWGRRKRCAVECERFQRFLLLARPFRSRGVEVLGRSPCELSGSLRLLPQNALHVFEIVREMDVTQTLGGGESLFDHEVDLGFQVVVVSV